MLKTDDLPNEAPPTLRLSRIYPVKREVLFLAWTSADHVGRWFCPSGFTASDVVVDPKVGGRFELCMRAPEGVAHWLKGRFTEVSYPERLAFDATIEDAQGRGLFRAVTVASFADAPGGAQLEVTQTYEILAHGAAWMPKGAPQGWEQTLDKLENEVIRLARAPNPKSLATHSAFEIERVYDAPVDRVFSAFSNIEAKSRWFEGAPGQWTVIERKMNFQVGGRERLQGLWKSGAVTTFDAVYHDIVENARIVYSYDMHLNEKRISVSLATILLDKISATRTRLKVVEQGAFLDGYEDAGSREKGTGDLLDRLGASLKS